ncbi:transmembrane protein KIAA1109 homolog isoform X2 [Brienomyrus brachyistius]|uniref:transmembrane protein KIAA1109 homolog isoform X2 n=1 Tax=Brienomyrus brachyistius TaxID=42636 RepID=UPI0020B1C07D|nr:transmembrane protein KIAA1109 homolog isoform X2 [Brienomyrus brachyistius]
METKGNESTFPYLEDLDSYLSEHNSTVVWLVVATILSCGWIIYLTYYNSRNIGLILTLIINRLYKNAYVHIGSFSFSVLSGKVMFRDVYYINADMSVRIQDGLLIFRWWKMYSPKQKQNDPRAETRLHITLNGFEFHAYNRTALYARLQETFGLEATLVPSRGDEDERRDGRENTLNRVNINTESQDPASSWRSLIPVIKVNISTGRVAFGNHYLPQTLCLSFDDAFLTYATKPPSSRLDKFMHMLKGTLENVRVMLVPSPRYTGLQNDEPPRLMGEGFVVMQSNDVDIYYYTDEAGLVPEEEGNRATGESDEEELQDLPPCWGLDVVCGKGTSFNYGPWVDRQRDCLWKFFFPPDYQSMKVNEPTPPGQLRQILAFELRMNIIADATVDLLFSKNKETSVVHVNVGAGSYLEVNVPMVVGENGFSTSIKGQLLHVDTTSSMQYRTLLETEMLAFHINACYPRVWNMPQWWECEVEVYKTTYHFIYAQKNFFTDLIQDWASDSVPDIYSFVPYTWQFKLHFHQFEMIWAANQHNWIDCSTKQQENVYLAACGQTLDISFMLPFTDFVPATCDLKFSLKADDLDLRLCLPDCHPSRFPFLTLAQDCQAWRLPPDGQVGSAKPGKPHWRNMAQPEDNWVDCWNVPGFLLTFNYIWHPIYQQKTQLKPSYECRTLPLRFLLPGPEMGDCTVPPTVDPTELPPDCLHVEIELSPGSQLTFYGPLLRAFYAIKENYFGEDDMYTDFKEATPDPALSRSPSSSSGWTAPGSHDPECGGRHGRSPLNPLALRPWDITVLVNMYKVHGRLPVHCDAERLECPQGYMERFCFEMKKSYRETLLQLILSPIHVFVSEGYQRTAADSPLRDGHISLSGLQMRAHAMFSAEGLPPGSDTLEYAWLLDFQVGALTGSVTVPQLATLAEWGETFVFHLMSREFQLEKPRQEVKCQHGLDRQLCTSTMYLLPGPCRTSEELKYTMIRLSVDGVDLFVVEQGCAANVKTGAIRLANCNLHSQTVGEGVSLVVQDIQVRQYIEQQDTGRHSVQLPQLRRPLWLEAGSMVFALLTADVALVADHPATHEVQRCFLERHDARTKRLWFLWLQEASQRRCQGRCGCLGGCRFFGTGGLASSFFRPAETPSSSSSARSDVTSESDACYGQSLLRPGERIATKEVPGLSEGRCYMPKKDSQEKRSQQLSLMLPECPHSSASSLEENSSSSAALPLLASEGESSSSSTEDGPATQHNSRRVKPVSRSKSQEQAGPRSSLGSPLRSPLRSSLMRKFSASSTLLGSIGSLSAAPSLGAFRLDQHASDSPQHRSIGSLPVMPSADSGTFRQNRFAESSVSVADSEAYYSAAEEFEHASGDECPGTFPRRKKKRRLQAHQVAYSRGSIYHSMEGPLASAIGSDATELRLQPQSVPVPRRASRTSFVSTLAAEDVGSSEVAKALQSGRHTAEPQVMACYHSYLAHYQVFNWSTKQPVNKRMSRSSLQRPLDLDMPASEESSFSSSTYSFDHLSIPIFKAVKQGLSASSLLDRSIHLTGDSDGIPYTPLESSGADSTDDDTTADWSPEQPSSQPGTTAFVEVKGAVDVVLTPLVAEALDRYIKALARFASIRHPASMLDGLHAKVLSEAYQISKSTVSDSHSLRSEHKTSRSESSSTKAPDQADVSAKSDSVKIKGLQANVTIPKVNLCLLQASVAEACPSSSSKRVTQVSLVALCFDRIATQLRMNRGIVEEGATGTEHGRPSVGFNRYASAANMQPQTSGSLRSNASVEKGKEMAARLSVHRIHGQLRGLDSPDPGACTITAIPFEKSKVLFSLEEPDEFSFIDETEHPGSADTTRCASSPEKWGWIMFECGMENLTVKGGRQSGAMLFSSLGVMVNEDGGTGLKSNGSSGSQPGSGYSTDVSEDHLGQDPAAGSSFSSESNSDEQDEGVESDNLKNLPLVPPPPDSSSMKLTIKEVWFSFAAPTNVRSPAQAACKQLNLLSTATPAIGAWLVPMDQLKSSLSSLDTVETLRVCAVMACIMSEALEKKSIHIPFRSKFTRVTRRSRYLHDDPSCLLCSILHRYLQQADYGAIEDAITSEERPALVTLKKGLVALARQWMKFIVVTQGFKAIRVMRSTHVPEKASEEAAHQAPDPGGGARPQSDTSADGADLEFDAAPTGEHIMLLETTRPRPSQAAGASAHVSGSEFMKKISRTHRHTALKLRGSHPYQSLNYTSGDTVAESPAHTSQAGAPAAGSESPRKEGLFSYITDSLPSMHSLLEGVPQRGGAAAGENSSLSRTGNSLGLDTLTENPVLSEPSSVSFYDWMSSAVGNRGAAPVQDPTMNQPQHGSLQRGAAQNLQTIPSVSDVNAVLSSDTLDSNPSLQSCSQEDLTDVEETQQCPVAVQLADAQVVFKPLLSHTGIQPHDTTPLSYRMYFGEHLSLSGTLERLRADIVNSDTSKERKNKKLRRQSTVQHPSLELKPALKIETFSLDAVVMEKCVMTPQSSANALSFHDLNRRHSNTFHCNFTISCQSISQHVDMALVRLVHQFSTMIDDVKATHTDIKLNRYTAGSASPTPTYKPNGGAASFRSSRGSRSSASGPRRTNSQRGKRASGLDTLPSRKEVRSKGLPGRTDRRTRHSQKGSRDGTDHTTIQVDDSDSEQSEPSAKCWQDMYKLLNFYSLISDPRGILERSCLGNDLAEGGWSTSEHACRVVFENEKEAPAAPRLSRSRSLGSTDAQHVTFVLFGVGMVNRVHLEADIGGLTMQTELKKVHGSFMLKEKMKDMLHQKMTETSATAHIGGVNIVLLEGITPNVQMVVKCNIAKSQALYSAQRGLKTNNAAVWRVGAIFIDIPQHPATLHSMMVRSSHQLSKQISDLIRQPSTARPSPSREDTSTPQASEKTSSSASQTPVEATEFPQLPEGLEKKPIVLKFSATLDGLSIGAALLPSLKAEYKMGPMKSHGMTGAQTRFTFELPNHKLHFTSKVSPVDMSTAPPSATLALPPITMSGEYIMEEPDGHPDQAWASDDIPSKQGYLQGNYLCCIAEIGSFEHSLTTDLLNHLVFLQKVFMKEVNEVIQKVSGGEQPIPLWNEPDIPTDGDKPKILLYSVNLKFKGIQVTATTPSMQAVRLETGLIELRLSNRIQTKAKPGSSSYLKLFGKCQVELNLALGQIVKHQVYEEAGSDFHQVAYFRTRIGLRNALQEEISGSVDKEAVLITLNRPTVFAQPVAFDRAVLFWLNYKAAYDNWNEQRLALNKDIHMATREVVDKLPGIQQTSAQAFSTLFLQLTVNDLGICLPITSTLQASPDVDSDIGSSLVLTIDSTLITACSSESLVSKGHFKNFCLRFAEGFEITLDDWKPQDRGDVVINACVVPDGTYEVCSRTTGQASAESSSAGTWTLNVLWKMCGIDVHMDPNIGKRLSALGSTLTSFTGEEDVDDAADSSNVNAADLSDEDEVDTILKHADGVASCKPTFKKRLVNHLLGLTPNSQSCSAHGEYLSSSAVPERVSLRACQDRLPRPLSWGCESIDYKRQIVAGNLISDGRGRKFSKRIVDIRELNEQAKLIDDLKKLGASEGTINQEIQRFQQLESFAVNDVRRDVRKKLRRSSMRAASLKDKWGLSYKPSNSRPKSISVPGRTPLLRMERLRPGDGDDLPEIRVDAVSPGPHDMISNRDVPDHPVSSGDLFFQFPEGTKMDQLNMVADEAFPQVRFPFVSDSPNSVFSAPTTPAVYPPGPGVGQEADSSSSSSADSDREEEYSQKKQPPCIARPVSESRTKSTGLSAVSQLLGNSWAGASAARGAAGSSERNIDFELDIRVEIDSGKCMLHPTIQTEQDDAPFRRSYEHILKNVHQESLENKPQRPSVLQTSYPLGGKKVPSSLQTKPSDSETTIFYIPGVDVKLHYNSKTLKSESPSTSRGSSLSRILSKEYKLFDMNDADSALLPNPGQNKTDTLLSSTPIPVQSAKGRCTGGVKMAKLYAWVALQTLPEEMVISPCLLDFLEKALETIPLTPVERTCPAPSSLDNDLGQFEPVEPFEESTMSLVSSSGSPYTSFPVDVVVYVRVQPSQIRFSCLPVSRVECMLKLPSLDLVFSSNRGELDPPLPGASSSHSTLKNSTSKGCSPGHGSPPIRSRHSSSLSDLTAPPSTNSSGLSFTACMSDFSLYVFHPYGAGKQKAASGGLPPGSDEEPCSVTGRKDSLSINLEFVKVSLSRMRRTGVPSLFDSFVTTKGCKMATTLINISAVCDIGSASFRYDMRRLSEILAFPRAWYRRSIARRLFLGDNTINLPTPSPGTPESSEGMNQHLSPEAQRRVHWKQASLQPPSRFGEHSGSSILAHLKSPTRSKAASDSSSAHRIDSVTRTTTPSVSRSTKVGGQQGAPWETLVVFAINLKQLNVQMNMSNVMGNNTWTTSGLKSQGRLSVGSNRDREISMSVGLGRSQLDSKGGVVGGTIDVNTLEMVSHISEHPCQQPQHKIQVTMGSTEVRVDYMGSSILMGVFSNADLRLQDEWKVSLCETADPSLSEKSVIFVQGDLQWDIFQVIISRSTTPDLIKIGMKLQEFFTQQFDTSKRVLSTWGQGSYVLPRTPVPSAEKATAELHTGTDHHRHWPSVLKAIAGCHISLFPKPLPEDAVQLGGSMSLHGNHMTLACFHGPNFRSKSWAMFHLEEPNITFLTEAQKIAEEDGSFDDSTYVVQTLDFNLGHNTIVTRPCGALESPMATITKITRRRHENPPHGLASVKEWFSYVTAMRNEELNKLREVESDTSDPESGVESKVSSERNAFKGSSSYNHETETIFALPRMQLNFKSTQVQDPKEPSVTASSSKPRVECSVVTEFTDHICVTMDAELIMFLHDLVSAYLKEKENALHCPRSTAGRAGQKTASTIPENISSEEEKQDGVNYTAVDWREFLCNTWHLEPTVRLIDWTGRKIDPVCVDYILQKLGFHHARTTIPKWLQRGVMDPLDKVLSVLIKKLGTSLQDGKERKGTSKEEH